MIQYKAEKTWTEPVSELGDRRSLSIGRPPHPYSTLR